MGSGKAADEAISSNYQVLKQKTQISLFFYNLLFQYLTIKLMDNIAVTNLFKI